MKRIRLITIGVISLLVVTGAVFVGARLLNTSGKGTKAGTNEIMIMGQGGGAGPVAFSLDLKPAPELPQRSPEVAGLFERREDNSIFVGTGEIQFSVTLDQATGQKNASSSYSGPVLEVVVTHGTALYRDQTKMPGLGPNATGGEQSIQQVVKRVDSLDDLDENTKNTEIQVWGSRSGDRVVAEVLVYKPMEG